MISRVWRGLVRRAMADAYVEHLEGETFPAIRRLPGFISASLLRRTTAEGVEFLVITGWSDLDSIRAFAGPNAETAVVPDKARAMMIEFDTAVRHYEVVRS